MPPTTRGAHNIPFIALWVEDQLAKVWRVDLSGPIDEIARFSIEGMSRTTVLEIAAQFVRASGPRRPLVGEAVGELDSARSRVPANGATQYQGMGRPRKTDVPPKKRTAPSARKSRYVPREVQIQRQTELLEALNRHPDGINSQALAAEMGREVVAVAVPLGVLVREGKARRDADTGIWYPVPNAAGNVA